MFKTKPPKRLTFLEAAEQRCGPEFARNAETLLRHMDLPDAQPGEYLDGNESRQIFLDHYGLVVRAGSRSNAPEHKLILAPLRATRPIMYRGVHRVLELMPGVRAGVTDTDDVLDVKKSLKAAGIDFWDSQRDNCGYLPIRNEFYPNGIPVVLDRGAVKRDMERAPGRKAAPIEYHGTQQDVYAPLLKKLARSWPANENLPVAPMKSFMEACRRDVAGKGGGLLSNRWKNPHSDDPDYSDEDSPSDGMWNYYIDKAHEAELAGKAYAKRLLALKGPKR
jgi:hypothetical protein